MVLLLNFLHLKGTKAISSVIRFKPNFLPTQQDSFKEIITLMIVMKYANHDAGVKRFFKFHSLVVSIGYCEKK